MYSSCCIMCDSHHNLTDHSKWDVLEHVYTLVEKIDLSLETFFVMEATDSGIEMYFLLPVILIDLYPLMWSFRFSLVMLETSKSVTQHFLLSYPISSHQVLPWTIYLYL